MFNGRTVTTVHSLRVEPMITHGRMLGQADSRRDRVGSGKKKRERETFILITDQRDGDRTIQHHWEWYSSLIILEYWTGDNDWEEAICSKKKQQKHNTDPICFGNQREQCQRHANTTTTIENMAPTTDTHIMHYGWYDNYNRRWRPVCASLISFWCFVFEWKWKWTEIFIYWIIDGD